MRFPRAGEYVLAFRSNDGVRLHLAGEFIVEDPDVHKDRYSDYVAVKVVKGGWVPLAITYFQRKGTATLEFYWQPPGTDEMVLVPAAAYGHKSS